MDEVALFETALRAAVPTRPDPRVAGDLVPRLAWVARAATIRAEARASGRGAGVAGRRRARSRLASVARIGIAVALVPLVLAGLAVAGVTVPAPARDAFHSLGITLPNQPSEEHGQQPTGSEESQGGNDVSDAAKSAKRSQERGNSAAAHEHARDQRAKAEGEAVEQVRGRAIGLNEATPPGQSGETGAPAHSNAGGSARSQSARSAPRPGPRPQTHPFPPANNSRGDSE